MTRPRDIRLRDLWGLAWVLSGSLDIRWTGPVGPGDTVTPKGQITGVEDASSGRRITADVWVENQNGDRVVRGQAGCVTRG